MISNKLIGLAALVLLCGSAGFTAVGCSSSDDDAVAGDDDDDDTDGGGKTSSSSSGRPSSSGTNASGGSSGEEVEPPACYDQDTALQLADQIPGKTPGACAAGKVDDFWTLIFAPSDAEADAAAAAQDDFFNNNPACVSCLLGAADWDGDGSYTPPTDAKSPVLILQDNTAYLNSGACYAAAAGVDAACGAAVINQTLCLNTACQTCETDTDNSACQDAALAEGQFCADVEVPDGCIDALNAKEADITAACTGGDTFEAAFKRNAAYLCN